MQISFSKDPSSQPGEILAHVLVSGDSANVPPAYSHSFRYKVPSGKGKEGKIVVYTDKDAASEDVNGLVFSFDLEKCRNKECKEKNPGGCPVIADKPNRLLVADVFHIMPTRNTLQYFGTALFKALFSGGAELLLRTTGPTDPNGGIFLQFNKYDGDLDAIPWEYAKDGTTFLVHHRKFVRVLAREHESPRDPLPQLPPRIVVVAPDPLDLAESGYTDLHLGGQVQNFINEFSGYSIELMLERALPATVNKMNSLLAIDRNMATVLHFMGHCVALEDKSTRGLLFEDRESFKCRVVDALSLITLPMKLRLAFLSACNTREVARDLVHQGVWQAIGSYCPLPDDIARNSEAQFYHFLAQGLPVDEAIWRMRMEFQNSKELRQNDYFAGAMILYSTAFQTTNSIFQCKSGKLTIERNMSPNNLDNLYTSKIFFGRKKQLIDLNGFLRRMATRANDSFDICTITGIGGQGKTALAMEAIHLAGHFFPGGIFVWQFNDTEGISARDYLRDLANLLFAKDAQNDVNDVRSFGKAITEQFKASSLLFLDHADTLKRAAAENKEDAVLLVEWLQRIISKRDIAVKILATSHENLGWLGEGVVPLNGLIDSDIGSGCKLFVDGLNYGAKMKMAKEKNTKPLLQELVKRVNGHPLSLKILSDAVGLPKYLDKPLEAIVHEHYDTMLADADVKKELKRHFKPKIDALTEIERSCLYMCSLFVGPITTEILALVRYFVDIEKSINCSVESMTKILEQLCKDGYLSKDNDAYKIHVGFREGLRQHNDEFNIEVNLPQIGVVDAFTFGIPSKHGKSNVLEWQLRNMQSNKQKNSDDGVTRTFGIQYCDIFNNPNASNHDLEVPFRKLVVFTIEVSENFPNDFAELSAKQIKPIVEKRELPFILCFKCDRAKMAEQTIKNAERNILLKKAMNALQDDLRATHLIIRTEPLLEKLPKLSNINANSKEPSRKTTSKSNITAVHTYGDFVGREKELKLLKELLDGNSKVRYITILGFGGMGKTTLAIQAVKNFDSDRVLVLSFVKNPSFNSMLLKIAEFLNIDVKNSEDPETDVLTKLANDDTVLIYLDNMETLQQAAENKDLNMEKERKEAESIKRFFNLPTNVKILATSRVILEWPGEYVITLMGLEPEDGMQVFQQWASRRLKDFTDEDAKKISDVANGHPLSIRLLGGAFNKCKRPIKEFIDNITEQLMKAKDSLDQRYDSVNTCIQYSYDYLNENLKHLLGQLRRFNVPFSATLVSRALETSSTLTSFTEDDLDILCQQSWLNTVDYVPTLGDWRPRFMESDNTFYILHPRLQDFLDQQFRDIEVADFADPNIEFYTALCYATGFGVVNDTGKQIEWCKKAATHGHLEAQLTLAVCYEEGAGGVALNPKEAFYWYLKAAELEDRQAQSKVGKCYREGNGVDKDVDQARAWRTQSIRNITEPLELKFDFTLSLLHRAAENDRVNLVISQLEQGSVVDVKDRYGRTPLHLAAEKGHVNMVELLAIEFNAEINAGDGDNRTPLQLAALNGHTEVSRLLVTELGADIRVENEEGRTLLNVAAAGGIGIDVIRLFVDQLGDNVNANVKDYYGWTPLHRAAQNGHIDVMRMLVAELGADISTKDNDGRTSLHMAAENGHFDAMRILVAELGADKDEKDNEGGTLLHYAVKGGLYSGAKSELYSAEKGDHIDVVSLLVAELGTVINLEDDRRQTLLPWALQGGQIETAKQVMLKVLPTELSFEGNKIGAKGTRALVESLKQNTTLTDLDLRLNKIGPEGAYALAEFLKQDTTLTNLNIKMNKIGDKGACALAESLKQNVTLTNLNLRKNEITTEGACALAESLKQNTTLTSLHLELNTIRDKGICALAESLKQNTTLTYLSLEGSDLVNQIGDEEACALAESLKQNTALTTLDLYNNKIGPKGAYALSESLKQNTTLTNLNLRANKISEEACALAESLKQNTTLTYLNIRGNDIGPKGACALAESLKQNTALTYLDLTHNKIGVEGAYALAMSLKQNMTLTDLILGDLHSANIGDEGVCALAESLKQNTTLLLLDLTDNHINVNGACALAESLKQNTTLTSLNLGGNEIGAEGACALAESLKHNTTLTILNLESNGMGDEEACALADSLKQNMTLTNLYLERNEIGEGISAVIESLDRNRAFTKLCEIMNLCTAEFAADINTNDKNGAIQLHMAELRKALTEFEKNSNANGGLTPLHVIVAHGHLGLVNLLAGEFGGNANPPDNNGWTPLHIAAARGYDEVAKLLVTILGANPNSKDNDRRTPLHRAADNGHVEIVRLLVVELGADANAKDNKGLTPLHLASEKGHVSTVKLLVRELGVEIDARSDHNTTPLHHAAGNGHAEMVKVLVCEFGANLNAKDEKGWMPLQHAKERGKVKVATLISKLLNIDEDITNNISEAPIDGAITCMQAQLGHQDNTAGQSETDIKISDGARDGTAMYDHGIRDTENLPPEKGEEGPSNNAGDSDSETQKRKQPQRGSDGDGLIWKTTVAVVSVGAVICVAWLLWGKIGPKRKLRR